MPKILLIILFIIMIRLRYYVTSLDIYEINDIRH